MSDQEITCAECGGAFLFREAEQAFYAERGLAAPPKRCKPCRQARKAQAEGGAGRGDARTGRGGFAGRRGERPQGPANGRPAFRSEGDFGGGAAPRPYGGPPREFFDGRRPAASGDAPRNGFRPSPHGRPTDSPAARDDRPRFNGAPRGGANGAPDRGAFGGAPKRESRAFGVAGDRQHGDRRPSERSDRPRNGYGSGIAAPAGRADAWGTRPSEGGSRPPGRSASATRAPRETAARENVPAEHAPRRARPERPKYDITCAACGTQSQVPFKPLEDREVFCQPCYKARKQPALAPDATPESEVDAGIVE